MAGSSAVRAASVLLVLPLVFPAVLGIGVLIQPETIQDGNPISISVSNVTDGYVLITTLTATFFPAPGTTWLNFTNWMYRFALENGSVMVNGRNVNQLILLVRAGSTVKMGRKSGTGNITIEIPLGIPALLYHDFRIGYEVHNASAPLALTLVQQGTKAGPGESVLTPSITGILDGNLAVNILTNGTLQASKEIRVLRTAPLPTPMAGNATATLSPTLLPSPTAPPATTAPSPVPSLSQSPQVTPSTAPTPSPESPSPWIIGYTAVIIIIAVLADYLLLKD